MPTTTAPAAIIARDMFAAQGYRLTPEQDADLTARADAMRALTGRQAPREISIPVRTPSGALIGHMTYTR